MDGLRARRRLHFSPATPQNRNNDEDDKQRRYMYVKRTHIAILLALLALQFIIIIYAAVKHVFTPQLESTPIQSITSHSKNYDVIVTIYTYDRPRQLHALLLDIAREADTSNLNVYVQIFDDASLLCTNPHPDNIKNHFDSTTTTSNSTSILHKVTPTSTTCQSHIRYKEILTLVHARNWNMYSSYIRHGRRRYWHLIRCAHELLHHLTARYYIFLPDDDRLCQNFFTLAINSWQKIDDPLKTTLMLHIESTREHVPVWTNVRPRRVGNAGMWRIGWVESGNFLTTSKFLELFNYSFPRISPQRWVDNPPISSGVGALLSETIHNHGLRMYRTSESLVAHVGVSLSKMNAQFRQSGTRALETLYFADGDAEYEQHVENAQSIYASMASIWTRESSMLFAVNSLASQVDHLYIYLNGYDHIPTILSALPWITVTQGGDEDIGDIGKFYFHSQLDPSSLHATVDDDIVYPPDYIEKLVNFHRSFNRAVIVGVHGIRIIDTKLSTNGYYASRRVFMGVEHVKRQKVVHILGTGTVLYRVSDIGKFNLRDIFKTPNMADIWLGGLAQQHKIPMLVMPHNASWLREVDGTFDDSIYVRSTTTRSADRSQTEAALSFAPWQLHYP